MEQNEIVVFGSKKIRRIWHNDEWYFSVVDVVEALMDSPTPRQYWGKVKQREFIDLQLSPIWVQLKLEAADGKKYTTDCANTKGMFCIIQSIPSSKTSQVGWALPTEYFMARDAHPTRPKTFLKPLPCVAW